MPPEVNVFSIITKTRLPVLNLEMLIGQKLKPRGDKISNSDYPSRLWLSDWYNLQLLGRGSDGLE